LELLLELITGGRKETVAAIEGDGDSPAKTEEHSDGDVWEKGDKWYAKNDGETNTFDSEDSAKAFATGVGKTASPLDGYSFEVWGPAGEAEGRFSPFSLR
jgi:hypothetical protein